MPLGRGRGVRWLGWAMIALMGSGCATIRTRKVDETRVVGTSYELSAPVRVERAFEVQQQGWDVTLSAHDTDMCERERVEQLQIHSTIVREADSGTLTWEWIGAAVGLAASAAAFGIGANASSEKQRDSQTGEESPSEQTYYYIAGGAAGALGVGLLTYAIVDTVLARDEKLPVVPRTRRTGTGSQPCGTRPAADAAVTLETATGDAVPVGRTDANGQLKVDIAAMFPPARLQGESPAELAALVVDGEFAGTVPLVELRELREREAWEAVEPTPSSLRAFLAAWPLSPHAPEARTSLAAIAKEREAADWASATQARSTAALERYLEDHASGPHRAQARERIVDLEAQAGRFGAATERIERWLQQASVSPKEAEALQRRVVAAESSARQRVKSRVQEAQSLAKGCRGKALDDRRLVARRAYARLESLRSQLAEDVYVAAQRQIAMLCEMSPTQAAAP